MRYKLPSGPFLLETKGFVLFLSFQLAQNHIADNPWEFEFKQSNFWCLSHSEKNLLRCGLWLRYGLSLKSSQAIGLVVDEREDWGLVVCN